MPQSERGDPGKRRKLQHLSERQLRGIKAQVGKRHRGDANEAVRGGKRR